MFPMDSDLLTFSACQQGVVANRLKSLQDTEYNI